MFKSLKKSCLINFDFSTVVHTLKVALRTYDAWVIHTNAMHDLRTLINKCTAADNDFVMKQRMNVEIIINKYTLTSD